MILLIIPPEIQSIQQFRLFFTAELDKKNELGVGEEWNLHATHCNTLNKFRHSLFKTILIMQMLII